MLHQVWQHHSPPCGTQIFPYFPSRGRALRRTTETNCDHDATTQTPTSATATTAPGADENDDNPYDENDYVSTETDINIEYKRAIVMI